MVQQIWRRGGTVRSVFGGKNPDNFSYIPTKSHHYWAREGLQRSQIFVLTAPKNCVSETTTPLASCQPIREDDFLVHIHEQAGTSAPAACLFRWLVPGGSSRVSPSHASPRAAASPSTPPVTPGGTEGTHGAGDRGGMRKR